MENTHETMMVDVPVAPQKVDDHAELMQTLYSDAFAFSERERLALELHDQLRELELQLSLIEVNNATTEHDVSGLSDDAVQEQLIIAEREAMEARAEYELRNRITHNVMVMDPVIKAVHGSDHSEFSEKRMLPLIHENNVVSMVQGHLASKLVSLRQAISAAEEENLAANEKNGELSKTLLELTERLKTQSIEDLEDAQLREKVREVDKKARASRRRTRTLKGILAGMIVGSGIHWAEDEELRDLVMEDEEDG